MRTLRLLRHFLPAAAFACAALAGVAYAGGFAPAFNAFDQGDYDTAWRNFKASAESGDPYSQYNMAVFYADDGLGVPRNYKESVRWYRRAAMQGHKEAQFKLALMYIYGYGVRENRARARHWLRQAGKRGHVDAQYNMGFIFRTGRDVPRNDAIAARWYRLAADQGSSGALAVLGVMYAKGEGVPRDLSMAERLLEKAAYKGHPRAVDDLDFLRHGGVAYLATSGLKGVPYASRVRPIPRGHYLPH